MKKRLYSTLVAVTLSIGAVTANAYTIEDNYIGADPTHGYTHVDVLGNEYDVSQMDVNTSGNNKLVVDIASKYFHYAIKQPATIINDHTQIGDLFISTKGWKPSGLESDKYKTDTYLTNNTLWDYVAVLTPRIPSSEFSPQPTTGIVSVYAINYDKDATVNTYANTTKRTLDTDNGKVILSNIDTLNPNNWIYRAGQIVQFAPNSGVQAVATGTWNIIDVANSQYDKLSLSFDYSSLAYDSSTWGFHWTMTCGNDVIEGAASVPPAVPEPSTMILLGVGIVGLAGFRRLRK